ncbi:MAG: DUF2993 domain-containing protein, partial [Cyanobacteria bacterium P01_F01_bin.153]
MSSSTEKSDSIEQSELGTVKSGRLAQLLGAAVQFWLRTQVDKADTLEVTVGGTGRQLLSGCLPSVQVRGTGVVYQGLALQDVAIAASKIRVNLSQILRGKPLQLQEPITIDLEQTISADNLNRSIAAPLLAEAIADFVRPLLAQFETATFIPKTLVSGAQSLTLQGTFHHNEQVHEVMLTTDLLLSSPQHLHFKNPQWAAITPASISLPTVD